MLKTYMFSIGIFEGIEDGDLDRATQMKVYSRVAVHDDDGTANDDWVNDGFSEKMGSGRGRWTYMASQRNLLLWGQSNEFVARIKGINWPPRRGQRGSVELNKAIYGSKVLSYDVSVL